MRTLIVLVLLAMLILPVWFGGRYMAFLGIGPSEVAVAAFCTLLLLAFLYLTRRPSACTSASSSMSSEDGPTTPREISLMLDRMERRIESLETILLDREARVRRTVEHD